jgi:hypothetical protein
LYEKETPAFLRIVTAYLQNIRMEMPHYSSIENRPAAPCLFLRPISAKHGLCKIQRASHDKKVFNLFMDFSISFQAQSARPRKRRHASGCEW